MIRLKIKLECVSEVSKLKKFQRLSMIPRYDKFTKVRIRVLFKSRIYVERESSIDEDNIFVIWPPIVKGTSWNLRDLTSHNYFQNRPNPSITPTMEYWQVTGSNLADLGQIISFYFGFFPSWLF